MRHISADMLSDGRDRVVPLLVEMRWQQCSAVHCVTDCGTTVLAGRDQRASRREDFRHQRQGEFAPPRPSS